MTARRACCGTRVFAEGSTNNWPTLLLARYGTCRTLAQRTSTIYADVTIKPSHGARAHQACRVLIDDGGGDVGSLRWNNEIHGRCMDRTRVLELRSTICTLFHCVGRGKKRPWLTKFVLSALCRKRASALVPRHSRLPVT
jgi:hypothetical protein